MQQFCANSHLITAVEEPEQDRVRYRVEVKQPHVSVYLILGDVLQCLRTALDQAVWSMIYHRTGIDSQASEFPIFASALTAAEKKVFERKTKGLPDGAITYIESIQPYNHVPVNDYPLWQLHELNRIDKHRRISVRPQLHAAGRNFFGAGPPREDFLAFEAKRTDDGYDIVCSGSYKHHRPQITSLVLFGEAEIAITLGGVRKMSEFVAAEVLVRLAGFANSTPASPLDPTSAS